MVQFRPKARELIAKVVYYGPPLGGKTTNLRSIFAGYPQDTRGELIVVPTGSDRTIFFDFLPVDLGMLRGMRVRVQLYTVPGQVRYNATRQVVLRGVDGVVFVADSQRALLRNNKESWENLKDNLILQGLKLSEVAHVVQYNKRDLKDIAPIEELDEMLNEYNAPFYEAVASTGIGVEETLQGMVKLVIRSLRERFQLEGEQALTQPVHMGLRSAPEQEPPPPPPSHTNEQDRLPSAEEVPSTGTPEVTLVNYRPDEGAPFDPFRTQSLASPPQETDEPGPSDLEPTAPPTPAESSGSVHAVWEEATHPDLEAQVERLRWDREPDGDAATIDSPESSIQEPEVGAAEPEVVEEQSPVAPASRAEPEPTPGVVALEEQTQPPAVDDPFAVTGEVPPLSDQDLMMQASQSEEETGWEFAQQSPPEAATAVTAEPAKAPASGEAVDPAVAPPFAEPAPGPEPAEAEEPAAEAPSEPAAAVGQPSVAADAFAAEPGLDHVADAFAVAPVPEYVADAFAPEPIPDEAGDAFAVEQVASEPPAAGLEPELTADAFVPAPAPDERVEAGIALEGDGAEPPPAWDEPASAAAVEDFVFGGTDALQPKLDAASGEAALDQDAGTGPDPFAAPAEVEFETGSRSLESDLELDEGGAPPSAGFDAVESEKPYGELTPYGDRPVAIDQGAEAGAMPESLETEAGPAEPPPSEELGIGAAVAAVRAHGDAEIGGGEIGDEVEALAVQPEPGRAESGLAFGTGKGESSPTVEIVAGKTVLGSEDPFTAPAEPAASPFDEPFEAGSVPHADSVDDVFAITPAPPRQLAYEPETVVVPVEISAVRRAAGRALAQYGEVRELELEVPVPGGWTGGRRMTLQLRLTLVPQEEEHER